MAMSSTGRPGVSIQPIALAQVPLEVVAGIDREGVEIVDAGAPSEITIRIFRWLTAPTSRLCAAHSRASPSMFLLEGYPRASIRPQCSCARRAAARGASAAL